MNEQHHSERLARITLSYMIEPNDVANLRWLQMVTGEEALQFILKQDSTDFKRMQARHAEAPSAQWVLDRMESLGGGVLIPRDDEWPEALRDLGDRLPICLYYRGDLGKLPPKQHAVAMTGSRDCTSYGASVTGDLAYSLAQRGVTIISGGAYGVDAHAHRAAMAGHNSAMDYAPTIAVMAGGVDRFYPSGNDDLLRAIAATGLVLAEVPLGSAPTRYRFIERHRLIAALAGATVIPEARWRSGALGMAHRAKDMGRPVGAVPGSVHSANSQGCHRLMREGVATLVTDAAEVVSLLKGEAVAADV